MNGLVDEVKGFINNEGLLQPSDKILVTVSAGIDSVTLVHLLNAIGYQMGIAHANFQLRGAESGLDELLVKNLARQLKVPFYTRKFNVAGYSKKYRVSTQMAARELRYPWFEQLRQKHGYHAVVTGHHLNDLLETVLLNFTRGTGITGLRGILPKRGFVVRPLLAVTKQQILDYARDHQLEWREDRSNQEDHYQRNLIRNQVVPLLKKINPSLETTTKNTVEIIRSVERQYRDSLDQLKQKLFVKDPPHIKIKKSGLKHLEPALLADLIEEYGFNLDQCRSVLGQAIEGTGNIFQSKSHVMNVDRGEIIISPNPQKKDIVEVQANIPGTIQINGQQWSLTDYPVDGYTIHTATDIGAFDLDKLLFPLTLRWWQSGDQFFPLGMNQSKKLSDFLIDSKVPLNYKSRIQVLLSGKEIIWVVGYRIDDRYKITKETKTVLEIKVSYSLSDSYLKKL